MPSIVRLTLQRSQPSPWGLRLQGGADFEKALVISHVTEGTPSHASGLRVRFLSLPASQTRLDTGKPEMKVAKVVGEGDELHTLITPLESHEAILPPTEEREMRVTGARCSM